MSDPSKQKAEESEAPETGARWTVLGVGVSAVWLIGLGVYAWLNWQDVLALKPNEVGDALAGAFAPLAFLWLVLGFFQQGAELRNSGKALWLQGEELKNSVEQQRELVAVTREQLQFESEVLEAQRVELRRNAQPIFKLGLGRAVTSSGHQRQTFVLSNHGKPCTGVAVTFSPGTGKLAWGAIASGGTESFNKTFSVGEATEWTVFVAYLDELLHPGKTAFVVNFSGEKFSIEEDPARQPPEP